MDEDKTWIEPPLQPLPPAAEELPLPPMPPPPPPPGSGDRNWTVIGFAAGVLILVLCAAAGYGIWALVQNGTIPLNLGGTEAPDSSALTLTALVGEVEEALDATGTPLPPPTDVIEPPTAAPTDTGTPTETPTDTLAPSPAVPIFAANQALFCRAGPSTIYQKTRTMNGGDSRPILGRSVSPVDGISIWWQVEIDGRRCFVSSGLGTTEGDTTGLPNVPAPPTPTPTPTLTPTPTPSATPTP